MNSKIGFWITSTPATVQELAEFMDCNTRTIPPPEYFGDGKLRTQKNKRLSLPLLYSGRLSPNALIP
jgi:hypothetical protein